MLEETISKILINFSNQYPLVSGTLIILFVIRPFTKLGTTLFHSKVEKHKYKWNTNLIRIVGNKWYLKLLLWLIDTVFSIKLISDKHKIKEDISNGQHNT